VKLTRMTYIFDYLSNQISNQVEKNGPFWSKLLMGSNQMGHLVKLDKTKWHVWLKWPSQIEHPMLVFGQVN
jgi:hypothetical protein